MGIATFQIFFKGILAGLWVSIPLGPIGVLLIQRTMNKGLKSGLVSGLGVATADTFFAIVAAFGLTFLTNFFEDKQTQLTLIGGLIMLFIGIKMFKSNPAKDFRKNKKNSKNRVTDFFSMFFLTITNPITILVFSPVFALLGIGLSDGDNTTSIIVTFGIYFGASLWWLLLSSGVNFFRHKIRLRNLWWMNRITGIIIIVIAIVAATSSVMIML